jgi:hypothetical protein
MIVQEDMVRKAYAAVISESESSFNCTVSRLEAVLHISNEDAINTLMELAVDGYAADNKLDKLLDLILKTPLVSHLISIDDIKEILDALTDQYNDSINIEDFDDVKDLFTFLLGKNGDSLLSMSMLNEEYLNSFMKKHPNIEEALLSNMKAPTLILTIMLHIVKEDEDKLSKILSIVKCKIPTYEPLYGVYGTLLEIITDIIHIRPRKLTMDFTVSLFDRDIANPKLLDDVLSSLVHIQYIYKRFPKDMIKKIVKKGNDIIGMFFYDGNSRNRFVKNLGILEKLSI